MKIQSTSGVMIMALANEDVPNAKDEAFLARGANVEEAKAALLEFLNDTYDVYRYEVVNEDVGGFVALTTDLGEMPDPFVGDTRAVPISMSDFEAIGFVIEEMETGQVLQGVLSEYE